MARKSAAVLGKSTFIVDVAEKHLSPMISTWLGGLKRYEWPAGVEVEFERFIKVATDYELEHERNNRIFANLESRKPHPDAREAFDASMHKIDQLMRTLFQTWDALDAKIKTLGSEDATVASERLAEITDVIFASLSQNDDAKLLDLPVSGAVAEAIVNDVIDSELGEPPLCESCVGG